MCNLKAKFSTAFEWVIFKYVFCDENLNVLVLSFFKLKLRIISFDAMTPIFFRFLFCSLFWLTLLWCFSHQTNQRVWEKKTDLLSYLQKKFFSQKTVNKYVTSFNGMRICKTLLTILLRLNKFIFQQCWLRRP